MESYSDILEHELESAVEVKDKDSLHRAVRLIAERIEAMQTQMNQRFEAMQIQMDHRFDEAGAKSRLQTAFLGMGLTIVTTAVLLVNFLR